MREILTILACLLIACLTAALVGPHFVDWRAQRPWIEARLSQVLGTRVEVAGDIGVELLPTPRLELSDIRLPDAARISGTHATFELAFAALLRGALQFSDIEIRRPRLELTLGADGAVALPEAPAGEGVQIDRLVLRDGTLVLADPARGTKLEVGSIDLDGQADSLAGPFKATGTWRTPENLAGSFKLATAAADHDRLRLKLAIDPPLAPRLDLDGTIVATSGPAGTRLAYQGAAVVSSRLVAAGRSFPWRATGTLDADATGARLDIADARVGDDELALGGNGKASLTFGPAPTLVIGLDARQIDLDRLFADKDDPTPASTRAVAALREVLARPATPDAIATDVTVSAPALVVGGDTATDLRLHLTRQANGGPAKLETSLGAPGGARIALDGTLATGDAPAFTGRASLATRDLPRLRDWLAGLLPATTGPLTALDLRRLDARGEVNLSPAGLAARDLDLVVDRSHLGGRLGYTAPADGRAGRLVADLDASALDIDGLPDLTSPALQTSDLDLDLKLKARAVRVARVGDGMIDAGRIGLDLTRTGPSLTLKNLSIADIGGASVTASGAAGAQGGSIHATLVADRLGDLAALVGRVAPGRPADWLAARATALSPARLTLDLDARREKGGLLVTKVDLSGTARGTTIEAHGAPDARQPSETDARLRLESANLPMLLRQIGFDTLPLSGLGTGRVLAQVHAAPDRPWETNLEAELGGSRLEFDGRVEPVPGRARGTIRLRSGDTGPLLQALAVMLPDAGVGRLPVEVTADLDGTTGGARFERIAGTLFGPSVTGDVAIVPPAPGATTARAQVTGALAFDRLSLPALASLALGPGQPAKPGALWSDAPFGAALASPPELQLDLQSRRLQVLDGFAGEGARLRLAVSGGVVALEDASVTTSGGRLAGRLQMRRDKATASLSGELTLEGQPLDRPSLAGKLSGTIDVSSTGASAAALVAGLAGTGTLRIDDLTIPRTAPDALARLLASADTDGFQADEPTVTTRLSRELDRTPLALGIRRFDIGLAGGQLRLAPKDEPARMPDGTTAQLSGGLDLRTLTLDERVAFVAPTPKDWKDASPPQMAVVWRGPLATPQRDLEAGTLVAGLSARSIARETARIEAFESDVRERAFFIRRLKGLQFMRQREAEIAAFLAEQARRTEADARAQREREQQERDINQMGSGALNLPPPRPALPVAPLPGGG